MFRLAAFFGFISCILAAAISNSKLEGRIFHGEDTTIEKHPHQVSLQIDGFHFCGGSIISEDIIVTSAHCLENTDGLMVRLGSTSYDSGGILVPVKSFKVHELYDAATNQYDVGVLKLATPVQVSSAIRFIKLAQKSPSSGTNAVVTGWGAACDYFCVFSSITLQFAEVNIVDRDSCSSEKFSYGDAIKYSMFCAYGQNKDSCQGDSGGSLVANNLLVGIVSWGIGCGDARYPGVYCDVAVVRDWIDENKRLLL